MDINDKYYEEIQNNINKRTLHEKYRKEQHGKTRIIYNREISPVQIYQNVMNNTTFIYRNRVPEEGKKVITGLKGIKRNKIIGSLIQWFGLLLIVLFVIYIINYNSIDTAQNIKLAITLVMFVGAPTLIIVGGFIRIIGRKYMADYIEVWNPIKTPVEINCLSNGQLVVIYYSTRNKECGGYLSALNMDDSIWRGGRYERVSIPSYVKSIYVIDSVKSCRKTENGLMIESSGTRYGVRRARLLYRQNAQLNTQSRIWLSVFAETLISYRKEEIPAIFTNMEQLKASLMNYGYFELGRNTFSPL